MKFMDDGSFSYFTAQLKERRPEIADFLLRCERNHLSAEDYTAMRHSMRHLIKLTENKSGILHKLAVSMQEAIAPDKIAAQINLISLGRSLLAACHEALLSTNTSPSAAGGRALRKPIAPFTHRPVLLCVDDDRIIHQMIEGIFGEHITVLAAQDGVEGLAMIGRHKPDLVLLDDAMPHMSGMKMIEALREKREISSVPVIMLTSSDRPQDIERANAAGAVDYIIKPFNPERLMDAVYKRLARQLLLSWLSYYIRF